MLSTCNFQIAKIKLKRQFFSGFAAKALYKFVLHFIQHVQKRQRSQHTRMAHLQSENGETFELWFNNGNINNDDDNKK